MVVCDHRLILLLALNKHRSMSDPNRTVMGRTTIQISDELADELYSRKERGESYEDVIWRNLDGDSEASE
jgi:hypothetical protein